MEPWDEGTDQFILKHGQACQLRHCFGMIRVCDGCKGALQRLNDANAIVLLTDAMNAFTSFDTYALRMWASTL